MNDHLAGATAGLELMRRASRQYAGTELGRFLAELTGEVEADYRTLQELMSKLGIAQSRLKIAAGWTLEKLGRAKLNGKVLQRSPLTPFVELEGMCLGITGKRLLWGALRSSQAFPDGWGPRIDELIDRADSQLAAVEQHRVQATRVFTDKGV